MTWRVAHSLDVLLEQINDRWPHRSKVSDGSIGDAAHQARKSDHDPVDETPLVKGDADIVCARDFTNDPVNGPGNAMLAAMLIASRDKRIKYIIADRRICAGVAGPSPWTWRPYNGSNPHEHHLHLSVRSPDEYYDDTTPWVLGGAAGDQIGSALWLQRQLNLHGASPKLKEDGDEGEKTIAATRAYAVQQLSKG